jgi:phage tail-like protein
MKRRMLVLVLVVGGLLTVAVAGGAWATSGRALPAPGDPGGTITTFTLTVDGRQVAAFGDLVSMTSGVESETLVTTNGDKIVKTLLPSKRMPDSVILRRGLSDSLELSAWHELVINGDVAAARRNATLTLFQSDGTPVARYHLENAWPSKLEVGELTTAGAELVAETVTLVCDRIQRVAV